MQTFLIIWIGQLISLLGSGLTSFALGVWIFQETGQATPFAMTVLIGTIPRMLLMPLAGSLADRWNRRLMMILSDTGSALVTLGIAVVVLTGELEVWHIFTASFIYSIFGAFQEPAYRASVVMLVPKKDLARANGMAQSSEAVQMLVAPLLAGFLFVSIGLQGIILIDFFTFFFALGSLLIVRIPQPELAPEPEGKKSSVLSDMGFGWRYLRERPGLLYIVLYAALVNFLLNFSSVLIGPLVLSFETAEVYGVINVVMGAGMLVGSIFIGAWGGPKRKIAGVFGFIALMGIGQALTGLVASAWTIGAGLFLMLFGVPVASGCSTAITQAKVEPSVQGRVFAIRSMISQSIMPVAFAIAGPLSDLVFEPLMREGGALANSLPGMLLGVGPGRGMGLMFVLGGLLLLVVTALAWTNPRIRKVEDELPDVVTVEAQNAPAGGLVPGAAD